jgi:hypothetical protein
LGSGIFKKFKSIIDSYDKKARLRLFKAIEALADNN